MELRINHNSIKTKNYLIHLYWILLLLIFVTSSIFQFQMILFGGTAPIPMTVFRYGAVALVLLIIFTSRVKNMYVNKPLLTMWFLFVTYLFFEIIYWMSIGVGTPSELIKIILFDQSYVFMFSIPLVMIIKDSVFEKPITITILWSFVALSLLGIAQFIKKDPLIPTESADGSFRSFSIFFGENVRAFSLFDSGYSFGHFLAVASSLIIFINLKRKYKILLLSLALFATYATLTRNTYIEVIVVILSSLILKKTIKKRIVPYLIFFSNIILGYLVINITPLLTLLTNNEDIFNTATYDSRVYWWNIVKGEWLNNGLISFLFGTGKTQGFGFDYVDNMYLTIAGQLGLLGLIFFFSLFLLMTRYVFKKARDNRTPLSMAICAFWTSFPVVSFFNISLPPYAIMFMILMIIMPFEKDTNVYRKGKS